MIVQCLEDLEAKVSDDMNFFLACPFNALEVKEANFQMGALKSLGPDDLLAVFYQKCWNIMGPNLTTVVLNILNNGDLIDDINQAKSPENMKPFKPIPLCIVNLQAY